MELFFLVSAAHKPIDNFHQYQLPTPIGLVRCDNSRPVFRDAIGGWLDQIVCDPPYGVRAGGRKSGSRKYQKTPYEIKEELRKDHIPATRPYELGECIADLLEFAAK